MQEIEKQDLSHYEALNVLIIDDQSLVHDILKSTFYDLGIRNVKSAENAYYGLRLCDQQRFHVVICAFNVKSDKDGFHLLEELKFKGHVSKRTVLIFVSADTGESLVNSIVELQPDDFWVKPLSPKRVQERLAYALEIKKTLYNVYEAMDLKEYSKVIYYVERHLLTHELAKYHLQLQRMKGEALLALNELSDAEMFYRDLLQKHKMSWVYLGFVKCLLKQNKMEEIEELLGQLTDKVETRFATYDLLAQYYMDHENYERAYEEIKKAAALAPRNIERNKKLWDLARLNHDHEGQYLATRAMATYAKNSVHDSPALLLNVIRAGIDLACTLNGEASLRILKQAERYITDLEKNYEDASQFKEQLFIVRARIHNAREERDRAERLIDAHVTLRPSTSVEDNLDKVKVFHELGKREEAISLLESVKKQISGESLTSQVVSRYVKQESAERSEIHFTPKQLNSMAAELYRMNKPVSALKSLEQALQLTPKNVRVALNILKVLAKLKVDEGLDEDQKELAQRTIEIIGKSKLDENQQQLFAQFSDTLKDVLPKAEAEQESEQEQQQP
ncbi:response regulator [Aliiglaciecola sp. CAU 1673]|uniref:response regulator n=1 Tax=Aliiglaciecola sp. CAU 1673 TaxID=3032595 RepID=UPI0023DB4F23|nr:response regulator [Aliiglaciecola sp. CAU 1673]MDF2178859.1 response regulator [Aliiglaciecola sp. CAU 1673]